MRRWLREIQRRQEHIGYFVICLVLIPLAAVLGRGSGGLAIAVLWLGLIAILEIAYRGVVSLGIRHRKTWWGKQRKPGFWLGLHSAIMVAVGLAAVMVRSPFARYASLALAGAGLVCFGILRALRGKDEI